MLAMSHKRLWAKMVIQVIQEPGGVLLMLIVVNVDARWMRVMCSGLEVYASGKVGRNETATVANG